MYHHRYRHRRSISQVRSDVHCTKSCFVERQKLRKFSTLFGLSSNTCRVAIELAMSLWRFNSRKHSLWTKHSCKLSIVFLVCSSSYIVFQLESRDCVPLLLLLSMRGTRLLLLGVQLLLLIDVFISLVDRRRFIPRTLQESVSHIVVDIALTYQGFNIFRLPLSLLALVRCYYEWDVVDEICWCAGNCQMLCSFGWFQMVRIFSSTGDLTCYQEEARSETRPDGHR